MMTHSVKSHSAHSGINLKNSWYPCGSIEQSPALVIFDCDGVLVDSEQIASEAVSNFLSTLGLEVSPENCRLQFQGLSLDDMVDKIAALSDAVLPSPIKFKIENHINEHLKDRVQPVPGIREVLLRLTNSDIPVCVASSGSRQKIVTNLARTDLLKFFGNNITSAEEVDRGKPNPDVFLLAASKMGIACERAAIVEDSIAGITAGVLSGAKVYGYAKDNLYTDHQIEEMGALIVNSMAELPRLMGLRC